MKEMKSSMLAWMKWRHDHKEMVKYRERNFRNLEALIEIHNIIIERPREIRKEVMLMTLVKINKQIDFYTDEIVKLEGIVRDFNGRDLNRYGKHLYNNYMALKQELGEIIDTLRELRVDIEEQIKLK